MTTKSERTRQRILDAAAHALATRGFAATSLKAIAEAVDMQDASLYYHFNSKDDLVLEVLRRGTDLASDAVTSALDSLNTNAQPLDALQAAVVAHTEAVLGGDDYPRANVRAYGQLPPELADAHRKQQRAYGDVWRTLLADAIEAGEIRADLDPAVTRLLVLGALNWAIEWYDATGDLSPADIGHQMFTVMMNGLARASHD